MRFTNLSHSFSYFLLLLLAFALLVTLGCAKENESFPSGTRVFGQLGDSQKQAKLINMLDAEGIYYELTNRGHILYKIPDTRKFLSIKRKALYGEYLDPTKEEIISISNQQEKEQYISQLNKNDIPYRVIESDKVLINGHWHQIEVIKYSQIYGHQVDDIRHQIYNAQDTIESRKLGAE